MVSSSVKARPAHLHLHKYHSEWEHGRSWLQPFTFRRSEVVVGMFCLLCQAHHASKPPSRSHKKKSSDDHAHPTANSYIPWVTYPCTSLEERRVLAHEVTEEHSKAARFFAGKQDVGVLLLTAETKQLTALMACFKCIYFNAKHEV